MTSFDLPDSVLLCQLIPDEHDWFGVPASGLFFADHDGVSDSVWMGGYLMVGLKGCAVVSWLGCAVLFGLGLFWASRFSWLWWLRMVFIVNYRN
jgi:hypothetical protein